MEGKIILRIRTNLGMTKLSVLRSDSLAHLQKMIIEKLNISNLRQMVLSFDLEGTRPLSLSDGTQTLEAAGLKHGDELFLLGKFEECVVEKSFINDQHEVIQAGKSLRLIEDAQPQEDKEERKPAADQPIPKEVAPAPRAADPISSLKPDPPQPARPAAVTSSSSSAMNVPIQNEHPSFPVPMDYEDETIRAPDNVQRMTLLEAHSPSRDLSPEQQQQLETYRGQLREAGLREFDIERELQVMRDEFAAQRLRRQMSLEDEVLAQPFSTLEELERLLQRHPISGRTRQTTLPFAPAPAPAPAPVPALASSAAESTRKRKLIDEFRLTSPEPVPAPAIAFPPPTQRAQPSAAAAAPSSSVLKGAGERSIQRTASSSSSSTPRSLADSAYQPLSALRHPPPPRPAVPSSSSSSSAATKPAGSTERRPSSSSSATSLSADEQFEEAMRQALEESMRSLQQLTQGINNPRPQQAPQAQRPMPRAQQQPPAPRATNPSRPIKQRPTAAAQQKEQREELERLRRLQEEQDERAARELQEREDELFARSQSQEGGGRQEAEDRERMRDFLHFHQPLPARLVRAIDRDVEDSLLRLVQQQQQPAPVVPANPVQTAEGGPFYDEEDELLARALANSLEDL